MTISITNDASDALAEIKENDPKFNFSGFVSDALVLNNSKLNTEQMTIKKKRLEQDIKDLASQVTEIDYLLPIAIEEDKRIQAARNIKTEECIEALLNQPTEANWIKISSFWEPRTGLTKTELVKLAREKKENKIAKDEAMEELSI